MAIWEEKLTEAKTWIEKISSIYCIFTILHQPIYSNNGSLVVTSYTVWEEKVNINQPWVEKGG